MNEVLPLLMLCCRFGVNKLVGEVSVCSLSGLWCGVRYYEGQTSMPDALWPFGRVRPVPFCPF